jgi:hypothetical protein
MIPTALTAVLLATLSAAPAAPAPLPLLLEAAPRWELGTAVGGGFDTNPLALASPSGSGFATARAWAGRRFDLSESDELRLQLHYDGLRYDSASDANLDRPELGVEWDHAFGERLLLRVAGRGALRYQGDAARDGSDASLRALLRFGLGESVGLRLGLGGFYRDARDPAYGGGSGRVDLGVDVALWRRASAVAGYSFEMGTDLVTSDAGGWNAGGGRGGAGLGATATRHALSADLLQAFPGGFFVQGGYAYSLERGAGLSADAHLVMLEAGWRR